MLIRRVSYPKVWWTILMISALYCWGICLQEAISWKAELRTSGFIRRSWEGCSSHTRGPSLGRSPPVRLDKPVPYKNTADISNCCWTSGSIYQIILIVTMCILECTLVRQNRAFLVSAGRDGELRGKELMLASSILSRKIGQTELGKSSTSEGLR